MALNLIIFGAPGSGKGTQSELLEKRYNLFHISTGDCLREEIKKNSPIGTTAKQYIDQGLLVPDEVILGVLKNAMLRAVGYDGVIFDGFPRTVKQAEALTLLLNEIGSEIDCLIDLQVPEEELVIRLLERGKTSGRSDDNEEAIRQRLSVYHDQTEPVIGYYKNLGKHLPIHGVGDIAAINSIICNQIDEIK